MTVAGYMGANDVPPRRCRCFLHHQQCSKRRDDTEMEATLLCGKKETCTNKMREGREIWISSVLVGEI